ncbi:hypothetical protein EEB12_16630 [Rhodococcus sp. WS1]|uniref:hypothetical protein n=1 Tax=Rhodococcus TaxID=1827 RepID=UPI001143F158|nr:MULTISPECIES: hypothetical protein [Rhodococcus]MDJ0402993.1 hypothetical protein [Rhodococcus erythropolis]ROZ55419.1 hypothetical protein EEB12_16630 [Rhodococcus sp. WS1]TQC39807.1 hypothetical protein EEB16_08580 [Rhodococcus sp. WS7]
MPSRVRLAIVAGYVAAPLVAVGIVALSERSSEQSPSPGEIVVIGSEGPAAQDDPNEPPPTPNPYAIDYPLPTATLELDLREVERSVYAQAVADLAPAPVDRAQCLQSRVPAKPGIKFSCNIYTTNEHKRTYFVTVGDVLGNYTITPA